MGTSSPVRGSGGSESANKRFGSAALTTTSSHALVLRSAVRDDLDAACNLIAGVLAEQMFDGDDFRLGSSINEIVFFQCVVENIAFKTRAPFEKIATRVLAVVSGILHQHRDLVELLAAELMRRGTLRGQALSRLLHAVKPLADLYQVEHLEKYQGAVRS